MSRKQSRRKSKTTQPQRVIPLLRYDKTESVSGRTIRPALVWGLLALLAINLFVQSFGDRLWNGGLSMLWQDKCLSYRLPSDRVAYAALPAGMALPPYLNDISVGSRQTWAGTVGASPYPIELAELHRQIDPSSSVAWESLPGPVFLHGLKDSQGHTRLVSVYALANNPIGWWTLVATARQPGTSGPGAPNPVVTSSACWPMQSAASLLVFAGQPSRSDPSSFTLHVRLNGSDQLISGALKDDGTVEFKSSTGYVPWDTSRAGRLVLPRMQAMRMLPTLLDLHSPYEPCENVLIPVD